MSARSSAVEGQPAELLDDGLDLGVRAGVVDDPAQPLDVVRRQVGAQRGVELRGLGRGSGVQGEGDQDGALALDQVVAGGLAGEVRVAEDAEQVVAELERLAERQPEGAELAPVVASEAPARAAPTWSGRSMLYFADL